MVIADARTLVARGMLGDKHAMVRLYGNLTQKLHLRQPWFWSVLRGQRKGYFEAQVHRVGLCVPELAVLPGLPDVSMGTEVFPLKTNVEGVWLVEILLVMLCVQGQFLGFPHVLQSLCYSLGSLT